MGNASAGRSGAVRWMLTILALLLSVVPTLAAGLRPFSSDGCSRFPDGTPENPGIWRECCLKHDSVYWRGGSYDERLQADLALRACVEKRGYPRIAELMFIGVRMGGSPYWPTSFRWGYGWPYLRGYKPLDEQELLAVRRMAGN